MISELFDVIVVGAGECRSHILAHHQRNRSPFQKAYPASQLRDSISTRIPHRDF